jgi:hypothetical protein
MNLNRRLKRLERRIGNAGDCPVCHGGGAPTYRAEFLNGAPPVEGGQCRHCNGVGSPRWPMKQYLFDSRAALDAV